jgi:hypothetical protein
MKKVEVNIQGINLESFLLTTLNPDHEAAESGSVCQPKLSSPGGKQKGIPRRKRKRICSHQRHVQ